MRLLNTETARRCDEKNCPCFSASSANGGAALLDRLTTEGVLFVRPARGVGGHHLDLVELDIELFGGDLGESRKDALTELGLAGEDDDGVVRLEPNPAFQSAVVTQTKGQAGRRLADRRAGRPRECRDDDAQPLGKTPP